MRPQSGVAAVPLAKPTGVRWRIFVLLLALISINYVDRTSLSIAMPLIAKEFTIPPAIQGLILSSFFWTYAVMQIPGGMLADRFKPRLVIAISTTAWGLFQAIGAAAVSWPLLVLTRLGLGVAEAPIYPAGGKLNGIWMTRYERGRGATLLDGGAPLGAALGSLIITSLITAFGSWRIAFVVAGAGTVLCGLFAWYYIRNVPREHPDVNDAELDHIERALQLEDAESVGVTEVPLLRYFRFRSVWCMHFGWMCFNAVFYGLLTWMPTYLYKARGFDINSLGNASFFIFFAGFVGEIIGGWLGDGWLKRGGNPNVVFRALFGIAASITTVSVFSVAYVSSPRAVVLLLASTLFFLRWCGMYWAIPSILASRARSGFLGGFLNLGGNIAGIFVPLIVGLIVQFTGSYFLALAFFAAAGIGLLLCSLSIDYTRKIQD
jgi:ACS family D-galactonate transporter-like MFS transporter